MPTPRSPAAFSVVVPTLGRSEELAPLLSSLRAQTQTNIEVIVVDQNADDRLVPVLAANGKGLCLHHLRTPDARGLSRGRNAGWLVARGTYVIFADDDCWYPHDLFERTERAFAASRADIVCGRAADLTGRSINGRFENRPQKVTRDNVWTTSIEWTVFFKRDVLTKLDGYDVAIGVGAATPWQAAEGQDILLRALSRGCEITFDPNLFGHHPELDIRTPDAAMLKKARAYGRGMGFVLRKHGFGVPSLLHWIGRPSGAALIYAVRGELARARYYSAVARGRLEGYLHWARS